MNENTHAYELMIIIIFTRQMFLSTFALKIHFKRKCVRLISQFTDKR